VTSEDYQNLIIRQLLGEADAKETELLEKWLGRSTANQKMFDDLARIWRNAPGSEPRELPDIDEEWRNLSETLAFDQAAPARVVPLRSAVSPRTWSRLPLNPRIWAVAALALIIITASFIFERLGRSDLVEVAAGVAAQEIAHLPDGSTVRLNSVSKLTYLPALAGNERVVSLSGEAFFEIAKDGRPFIVKTTNARVRVLGTVFNVWNRGEETRVIVEEGRVALQPEGQSQPGTLQLTADQMGVCVSDSVAAQPIAVDAKQRLGWLQGKIVFSKTPLVEVAAELERRYDVRIKIENPDETQTLTASFGKKPVRQVLESVCLALNLRLRKEGATYVVF